MQINLLINLRCNYRLRHGRIRTNTKQRSPERPATIPFQAKLGLLMRSIDLSRHLVARSLQVTVSLLLARCCSGISICFREKRENYDCSHSLVKVLHVCYRRCYNFPTRLFMGWCFFFAQGVSPFLPLSTRIGMNDETGTLQFPMSVFSCR